MRMIPKKKQLKRHFFRFQERDLKKLVDIDDISLQFELTVPPSRPGKVRLISFPNSFE